MFFRIVHIVTCAMCALSAFAQEVPGELTDLARFFRDSYPRKTISFAYVNMPAEQHGRLSLSLPGAISKAESAEEYVVALAKGLRNATVYCSDDLRHWLIEVNHQPSVLSPLSSVLHLDMPTIETEDIIAGLMVQARGGVFYPVVRGTHPRHPVVRVLNGSTVRQALLQYIQATDGRGVLITDYHPAWREHGGISSRLGRLSELPEVRVNEPGEP